jgi:hypothetical protein
MYEDKIMKPAKNCFKRGEGGFQRVIEGVNLIKTHCVHVWKYNNVLCTINIHNKKFLGLKV